MVAAVTSSGGALFTKSTHGLVDGDYIYIVSPYSAYNGYWYVEQNTVNDFYIREYPTASVQAFVNSGNVTYYKSQATHGWNCVHLPIVYKLKSDIWPINGVDTARTITTFSNWNGYTYLVLSGDVKSSGTAANMEQVVLSGTSIDGVYKIIQWFSDTNFVIDLQYSGSNVLSGGTCQFYYLNYHARVKVYAGLAGTHYWTGQKPYELIAEERLIPDSSGVMVLNVADYAKKQIQVLKNNLSQDTLPNDLDAWTRIYISVAESYDDSNMYTVSEYVSSYTDDTTAIYATNAKQPFKTRASGYMDDYVSGLTSSTRQKFLTPFIQPTYHVGYLFDLSYINNSSASGNYIKRDNYRKTNGNYSLLSSTLDTQTDYDEGIYRYRVVQTAALEDRVDLTLYNVSGVQLSETKTIDVVTPCSPHDTTPILLTWLNQLGGWDYWLFTAQKRYSVDVTESKTQDLNTFNEWPKSWGEEADSVTRQTSRKSKNQIRITSQLLTQGQLNGIAYIKSSPLVQIISSVSVSEVTHYTGRTVIIDSDTLPKYSDRDNTYTISFLATYTDEISTQAP